MASPPDDERHIETTNPSTYMILRRGDYSRLPPNLSISCLVLVASAAAPTKEDGKNLLAYDLARQWQQRETLSYFLEAIETVRANKERYAQAETQARQQRPSRPVYYDLAGDGVS